MFDFLNLLKDLPKEGMNHNKALHITVITTGKRVPMDRPMHK